MTKPNIHVVHRSWDREFPVVEKAEGIYLYDNTGKRYIDGSGGSSVVTSIGHGNKYVLEFMTKQAEKFSFIPAHGFTNQPQLDLGDLLVDLAPGELRNRSLTWFACTGSDANDDAVRLTRQYFVESGKSSKYQIIGRWRSFHGNTISAAGISGITGRRSLFQPMYVDSPHIPPAFCYRCSFEQTYPACKLLCARALESIIRQLGPETVAAFIAEPVVGAALGCVPAPEGYFQKIREICTRYDVLFITDEVMTGWGRTGKLWGIDHWDTTPDIVTTAKGISGGYSPFSAIIARESIWSVLRENHSPFKAGHTLNANAVSCSAALAVIHIIQELKLVENADIRGRELQTGLKNLQKKHGIIGDVRGKGLMVGFEFVKEAKSRETFPPRMKVSDLFEKIALNNGLVTYPCTGSVDGVMGDMIMLAPPLIISADQISEMIQIIDQSISELEQKLSL
ncbi:MAG: aminotransferase class III-fold pyridoxal phosphate-dependent enzyme [Leptolinea sp.]|nr:aminotransferase class III-fold pyridoxal phosphate-dependent enzyme [Leptolinea sp.]